MKYTFIALCLTVAIAVSGQTKYDVNNLHNTRQVLEKVVKLEDQVRSLIKEVRSLMDDQAYLVGAWDRGIRDHYDMRHQIDSLGRELHYQQLLLRFNTDAGNFYIRKVDSLKDELNLVEKMVIDCLQGSLAMMVDQNKHNDRLDSLIADLRKPVNPWGWGDQVQMGCDCLPTDSIPCVPGTSIPPGFWQLIPSDSLLTLPIINGTTHSGGALTEGTILPITAPTATSGQYLRSNGSWLSPANKPKKKRRSHAK